MFNNTFQVILLLVTFTIRRKNKINLPLKANSCPNISHLQFPGHLKVVSIGVVGLCSLRKWPSLLLQVATAFTTAEEPSVFRELPVPPGFQNMSGALEPVFTSPEKSYSHKGTCICLGPTQETCFRLFWNERSLHSSFLKWKVDPLSSSRSRQFTQQRFPFFLKTQCIQTGFYLYLKVLQQRLWNTITCLPSRTRHSNKPLTLMLSTAEPDKTSAPFLFSMWINYSQRMVDLIRAAES